MKDKLKEIQQIAEESKCIPTNNSILRATVAAIPMVGGALDHLIFDKADEIRLKNIENSICDITTIFNQFSEENIDQDWFESEEAIQFFKQLIDKIEFEQDHEKSEFLSKIYALGGTNTFSNDPNKFAVLRTVSDMTTIQIKILQIVETVSPMKKDFSSSSLRLTSTAIWFDGIKQAITESPDGQFCLGTLQLEEELEIIESLNLIRRKNAPNATIIGYEVTGLGKLVMDYLKRTKYQL